MSYQVKNKSIKWAVYRSPQCTETFERYLIENEKDLQIFAKAFKNNILKSAVRNMSDSLSKGHIIVATDPHGLSGYITYCYEAKKESTHPSAFLRVKVGEIL